MPQMLQRKVRPDLDVCDDMPIICNCQFRRGRLDGGYGMELRNHGLGVCTIG